MKPFLRSSLVAFALIIAGSAHAGPRGAQEGGRANGTRTTRWTANGTKFEHRTTIAAGKQVGWSRRASTKSALVRVADGKPYLRYEIQGGADVPSSLADLALVAEQKQAPVVTAANGYTVQIWPRKAVEGDNLAPLGRRNLTGSMMLMWDQAKNKGTWQGRVGGHQVVVRRR